MGDSVDSGKRLYADYWHPDLGSSQVGPVLGRQHATDQRDVSERHSRRGLPAGADRIDTVTESPLTQQAVAPERASLVSVNLAGARLDWQPDEELSAVRHAEEDAGRLRNGFRAGTAGRQQDAARRQAKRSRRRVDPSSVAPFSQCIEDALRGWLSL